MIFILHRRLIDMAGLDEQRLSERDRQIRNTLNVTNSKIAESGRFGFISLGVSAVGFGLMTTGAGVVPGLALVALGTIGTLMTLDRIGNIRKQEKENLREIDCSLPRILGGREAGNINAAACKEYNAMRRSEQPCWVDIKGPIVVQTVPDRAPPSLGGAKNLRNDPAR